MVQLQSTVQVQIISSHGQSSSSDRNTMQVEVRACMDNGENKVGCRVITGGGPNGTYTLGVRTKVQGDIATPLRLDANTPARVELKGTRVDRYA